MSERMNKERAKEELKLMRDNLKMDLQETQTTYWTDTKTTYDKRVELLTDSIQALDIAIESLEQDQETSEVKKSSNSAICYCMKCRKKVSPRAKECPYCKTIFRGSDEKCQEND